jgi:hypothetical protein
MTRSGRLPASRARTVVRVGALGARALGGRQPRSAGKEALISARKVTDAADDSAGGRAWPSSPSQPAGTGPRPPRGGVGGHLRAGGAGARWRAGRLGPARRALRWAGVGGVACAHGLGPGDASDVSQVTWLLLTQHLGSLQQPERLGSWLHATATREADRVRRLRGYEVPRPARTPQSDIPASASVAGPAGPGRERRLLVWSESGRPSASSEEHNERWNEGERDARESE